MDAPTQKFCKDLLSKKLRDGNFTDACGRPKAKFSCSNVKNIDDKLKKEKSKFKKDNPKHLRHHSQQFKLRENDLEEIDDNKSENSKITKRKKHNHNIIINNIHDFIRMHKFKLRNDFDRKHSEQFLQSKEAAFEKPFFLFEEKVEEKNRHFNFTLKND